MFVGVLIGAWLVPSMQAKEIIRDKSLDGKFALQVTQQNEGWAAVL